MVSPKSCTKLNIIYKGISLKIEHPEGRSSYTRINTVFDHSFNFFNSKILNLCFPPRMYDHTLVYINNHFNLGLELFNTYHATACVLWEYVQSYTPLHKHHTPSLLTCHFPSSVPTLHCISHLLVPILLMYVCFLHLYYLWLFSCSSVTVEFLLWYHICEKCNFPAQTV